MSTGTVIALIIAILAIGAAAWALMEQRKTRHLKTKFGPEYDRVLESEKNSRKAEQVLTTREKRVSKFDIRPLSRQQAERFADSWRKTQEHFVDNPGGAVTEADQLINQAMEARGYPMSDFEQQAADLSVDYPAVVENYRSAHEIALRHHRGQADTEELRRAMQCYRALFEQVIGTVAAPYQELRGTEVRREEVHREEVHR
jgi:hypothetical protein